MASSFTMPAPEVAENALLGPSRRSHLPNRMRCIADTGAVKLSHFRPDAQGAADQLDAEAPAPDQVADAPLIEHDTLWGGFYKDHFGHMASEGVHRLWAARLRPELARAAVVFQVSASFRSDLPAWFAQMLACFGIAPERVMFVNRVTRFERLHVPAQGRSLNGIELVPGYAGLLPVVPPAPPAARDLPPAIYVSRRRHIHTGTYLGESHVEALLRAAGFAIMTPETEPLDTVLAKFRAARTIVFAEGSAIHNLDLTGRIGARIFVIGRRPGTENRFKRLLASVSDDHAIFSDTKKSVGIDWNTQADTLQASRTCSFLDLPDLVRALSAFLAIDLPVPSGKVARRVMAWDLLRFLMDRRTGEYNNSDELAGRALRLMRETPAVRALFA